MPQFKNARRGKAAPPTPANQEDLAEAIKPLSPRPPTESQETVGEEAASPPPPPSSRRSPKARAAQPPQPPPACRPPEPPSPEGIGGSTSGRPARGRFKAFLTGCLLGCLFSPLLVAGVIIATINYTGPTLISQLEKMISEMKPSPKTGPYEIDLTPPTTQASPSSQVRGEATPTIQECGRNLVCLLQAAQNNQPARGIYTDQGLELEVSLNPTVPASRSQALYKLLSVGPSSPVWLAKLIGQTMTCQINSEEVLQNPLEMINHPQASCQGPLWESLLTSPSPEAEIPPAPPPPAETTEPLETP